jgi:hypothetical protein
VFESGTVEWVCASCSHIQHAEDVLNFDSNSRPVTNPWKAKPCPLCQGPAERITPLRFVCGFGLFSGHLERELRDGGYLVTAEHGPLALMMQELGFHNDQHVAIPGSIVWAISGVDLDAVARSALESRCDAPELREFAEALDAHGQPADVLTRVLVLWTAGFVANFRSRILSARSANAVRQILLGYSVALRTHALRQQAFGLGWIDSYVVEVLTRTKGGRSPATAHRGRAFRTRRKMKRIPGGRLPARSMTVGSARSVLRLQHFCVTDPQATYSACMAVYLAKRDGDRVDIATLRLAAQATQFVLMFADSHPESELAGVVFSDAMSLVELDPDVDQVEQRRLQIWIGERSLVVCSDPKDRAVALTNYASLLADLNTDVSNARALELLSEAARIKVSYGADEIDKFYTQHNLIRLTHRLRLKGARIHAATLLDLESAETMRNAGHRFEAAGSMFNAVVHALDDDRFEWERSEIETWLAIGLDDAKEANADELVRRLAAVGVSFHLTGGTSDSLDHSFALYRSHLAGASTKSFPEQVEIDALMELGLGLAWSERWVDASEVLHDALALIESWSASAPTDRLANERALRAETIPRPLAYALARQGRPDEALAVYTRGRSLLNPLVGQRTRVGEQMPLALLLSSPMGTCWIVKADKTFVVDIPLNAGNLTAVGMFCLRPTDHLFNEDFAVRSREGGIGLLMPDLLDDTNQFDQAWEAFEDGLADLLVAPLERELVARKILNIALLVPGVFQRLPLHALFEAVSAVQTMDLAPNAARIRSACSLELFVPDPSVPAAEAEARAVANAWAGKHELALGTDATVARFDASTASVRWVVGHGRAVSSGAHIEFSDGAWNAIAEQSGRSAHGTLFVLNSCESSATSVSADAPLANDSISLPCLLLSRDAEAVIGNRWEADDLTSCFFGARLALELSQDTDIVLAFNTTWRWLRSVKLDELSDWTRNHCPSPLPELERVCVDTPDGALPFGRPWFWANHTLWV